MDIESSKLSINNCDVCNNILTDTEIDGNDDINNDMYGNININI